jgi:hypothetical protein
MRPVGLPGCGERGSARSRWKPLVEGVREFSTERRAKVEGTGTLGTGGCRSRGGREETESDGLIVRNLAGKGVETADAGSLASRRRVSTAGVANPLPIVRLPERDTPRNCL